MDFSWSSIRASHAVLLCRMEQGEIGGWQEVEKIELDMLMHKGIQAIRVTVLNLKKKIMVLLPRTFPVFTETYP